MTCCCGLVGFEIVIPKQTCQRTLLLDLLIHEVLVLLLSFFITLDKLQNTNNSNAAIFIPFREVLKDYLLCRLDLVQWYWHCTKLVQDQCVTPSWCRTIRLHQVCTEGKRIKGKKMKGKCPRWGSNPAIPVTIAEIRIEVST